MGTRRVAVLVVIALAAAGAGCSSSGSKGAEPTTTSSSPSGTPTTLGEATTAPPTAMTVLVTNDDGYSAPGIDAMVEALRKMPSVTVTVVAPQANQSGTGGKTTAGVLKAKSVKTMSGYAATAVDGYPADSIRYALTTALTAPPNLVVSGINNGQNIGPFIPISGTVGAAEAAANLGIPAIAVSQGFGNPPDFPTAARIVVAWITAHRSEYNGAAEEKGHVININVPTCTTGAIRGEKQVPAAPDVKGVDITKVDCASTATSSATDVRAFVDGFATITDLDSTGKTVTATTLYAPT
jgi:5'-nucleotidase